MIHRMEVAPAQHAALKLRQAKEASRAGIQAWQEVAANGNGSPAKRS